MNICFLPVVVGLTEHDACKIQEVLLKWAELDEPEWRGYWLHQARRFAQARNAYYQRRLSKTVMG